MKKTLLATILMLGSFGSYASELPKHWGYAGEGSPEHWSEISTDFSLCQTGKNQSPIDIHGAMQVKHEALSVIYPNDIKQKIVNNGHAIQVNVEPGNTLNLDGMTFALQQFHFHTPSENTINGESFPMEVHLVHANDKGELTVLAIMFKEGKENAELASAWSVLPQKENETHDLAKAIDLNALLPNNKNYYRFSGSLTTPPCSEGVRWLVMKDQVTVSTQQIAALKAALHHTNNRPIQPLNGRVIID